MQTATYSNNYSDLQIMLFVGCFAYIILICYINVIGFLIVLQHNKIISRVKILEKQMSYFGSHYPVNLDKDFDKKINLSVMNLQKDINKHETETFDKLTKIKDDMSSNIQLIATSFELQKFENKDMMDKIKYILPFIEKIDQQNKEQKNKEQQAKINLDQIRHNLGVLGL
jgi:hypothetical protein